MAEEQNTPSFNPVIPATIIGIFAIAGSGALALNQYTIDQFDNRMDQIDASISHIFRSVAECEEAGHPQSDCNTAYRTAKHAANTQTTRLRYEDKEDCVAKHGECSDKFVQNPLMVKTFKMVHEPEVVAFQFAADDPNAAAPLYPTIKDGVAMRKDGKTFTLDAPVIG